MISITDIERPGDYLVNPVEVGPSFEGVKVGDEWVQTGPAFEKKPPVVEGDYVEYDKKFMHKDVFAQQYPDLFLQTDELRSSKTSFGTEFPSNPRTTDVFVRVDVYPNRVYKYNGSRWLEKSRDQSDTHLSNDYLEFLISKIATGEYDPDLLSDSEREQVAHYLETKQS